MHLENKALILDCGIRMSFDSMLGSNTMCVRLAAASFVRSSSKGGPTRKNAVRKPFGPRSILSDAKRVPSSQSQKHSHKSTRCHTTLGKGHG